MCDSLSLSSQATKKNSTATYFIESHETDESEGCNSGNGINFTTCDDDNDESTLSDTQDKQESPVDVLTYFPAEDTANRPARNIAGVNSQGEPRVAQSGYSFRQLSPVDF